MNYLFIAVTKFLFMSRFEEYSRTKREVVDSVTKLFSWANLHGVGALVLLEISLKKHSLCIQGSTISAIMTTGVGGGQV